MSASKRNLAIGLAALAVLAVVAALFLRDRNPRRHVTREDVAVDIAPGFTTAAAPPVGPLPTPAQSARKGQIYFHRSTALSKIIPGEGIVTRLPDLAEKGLVQYQIQSDRLSPDATRMAYGNAVVKKVADSYGSFPPEAIFVREIANSKPGGKLVALERSEIHALFWSPDSAQVAFTSWDADKGTRNWVVDVASQALHELKLPQHHALDGKTYTLELAAWSPDGNWFAAGDESLLYLVQMNRTGPVWSWSGRKRLTKDPHRILGGSCSFSPDGRKILFATVDEGVRMSLVTADVERIDDTEQLLVAPGRFTDLYGCWSPDGKRVAFSGAHLDADGKRAGQSGIYILDPSKANDKPAPVLEEVHPPEQSPLRLVDWR